MKARRRGLAVAATVAVSMTIGFGAVSAAQAASSADNLSPNVTSSSGSFYTDDQIDNVWRSITASYPKPLPAGVTFPSSAPAFFHPNDGKTHLFQKDLPEEIAARYWRCEWIGNVLSIRHSRAANPGASSDAAESAAVTRIGQYAGLPSIAKHLNVPAYEKGMSDYAKSVGLDPLTAEYNVECGGVTE